MADEYEEITLADIVGTLAKRKVILGAVFILVLLGGVAFTVFTPPEYESTTTVVPLEHADLIHNWLDSRHAGELVSQQLGDPLVSKLFPDRWDDANGAWIYEAPTLEESGRQLDEATSVNLRLERNNDDRFLALTVTLGDSRLARDGAIKEFTGISDPYGVPADAEVVIDTTDNSPENAAPQVYVYLKIKGYIR